jgi:hypothetical protein
MFYYAPSISDDGSDYVQFAVNQNKATSMPMLAAVPLENMPDFDPECSICQGRLDNHVHQHDNGVNSMYQVNLPVPVGTIINPFGTQLNQSHKQHAQYLQLEQQAIPQIALPNRRSSVDLQQGPLIIRQIQPIRSAKPVMIQSQPQPVFIEPQNQKVMQRVQMMPQMAPQQVVAQGGRLVKKAPVVYKMVPM